MRGAVCHDGPVLVRVVTDYGKRKIRWVEAVRDRYTKELTRGAEGPVPGPHRLAGTERRRTTKAGIGRHEAESRPRLKKLPVSLISCSGLISCFQPNSSSTFHGGVFSNSQPTS